MPKKRVRSPQEKKRLSLRKDGRNSYGENDKSSRKAIPLRKKLANRWARRADRLTHSLSEMSEVEYRKRLKRRWKKVPDKTLEDHLSGKGWIGRDPKDC